jgi:hypothetical protein
MDKEKIRKHLNLPVKIQLENRDGEIDEFTFLPLNAVQYATLMGFTEKFQENTQAVSKEDATEILSFFIGIVKHSYPELTEEEAEQFAIFHFQDFNTIMEKLTPVVDKRKLETIKRIQENAKSSITENKE